MTKRIQFDAVLLPAFEIFVDQSDQSRSVTKPKPGEIWGFQRIELNGFSAGVGNATKISPAGDVFGRLFDSPPAGGFSSFKK